MSKENPYSFILCESREFHGLHWLPIICKKQHKTCQILFQRMSCDLDPQSNFIYRYFTCNLPEDTIDVEVTVCTLKGIYTFRKDPNTQMSTCSPWHTQVRPFPSLRRRMEDYIKEHQNIMNPFSPKRECPNRPKPPPFTKNPKPPQPREATWKPNITLSKCINQEK